MRYMINAGGPGFMDPGGGQGSFDNWLQTGSYTYSGRNSNFGLIDWSRADAALDEGHRRREEKKRRSN